MQTLITCVQCTYYTLWDKQQAMLNVHCNFIKRSTKKYSLNIVAGKISVRKYSLRTV